jgi:cytolysin-activating lysine-acyltransferase
MLPTKTETKQPAARNGKALLGPANDPTKFTAPTRSELPKLPSEIRTRLHAAVGQVVLALCQVERYKHQSLADLQTLVVEPLMHDRIAIAHSDPKVENRAGAELAGLAIWATVSDEVDVKIREQIKCGGFPIRLKPEDWTSGEKAWLLDVIAPSEQAATAVLVKFTQVVRNEVRIHPIVSHLVEVELLKKITFKDNPSTSNNN